jgi:hypothetical protein
LSIQGEQIEMATPAEVAPSNEIAKLDCQTAITAGLEGKTEFGELPNWLGAAGVETK